MKYTGPIYRPPVEGRTPLLQVTVGCAHNKCKFCSMYREVQFSVEKLGQIENDVRELKRTYGYLERVFLVNGDAFVLRASKLLDIAEVVREHAPECETITMYASIDNIASKSDEELRALKNAGINDLYVGVESGWEPAVKYINKGHTVSEAYIQLERLNKIGIRHIALLMLGVGGEGNGQENAIHTAEFLNTTKPSLIWMGTLGVFEGAEMWEDREKGQFKEASELENLEEEITLLENLNLENTEIFGIHPSNIVSVRGTLPQDKKNMLRELRSAIEDDKHGKLNSIAVRTTL